MLWVRLRSVLDLWLIVVMCAYAIEVCVVVFPHPVRFSIQVVRRPGLRPGLWQSPTLCSAVRDNGALWATAALRHSRRASASIPSRVVTAALLSEVAEVVALPDLRSEVPEDRVRNRDVEEEVG